jgi:hypothetical protein
VNWSEITTVFWSGLLSALRWNRCPRSTGFRSPEIVLATHQVLPHVKHFANKGDWHVLVDEEPQAVIHHQHRVPRTHDLITKHLGVGAVNAIYGRVPPLIRRGEKPGR